jgi:hypothetical protein
LFDLGILEGPGHAARVADEMKKERLVKIAFRPTA